MLLLRSTWILVITKGKGEKLLKAKKYANLKLQDIIFDAQPDLFKALQEPSENEDFR